MATEPRVGENIHPGARSVGLPPRPFLYTLDQIATLLDVTQKMVELHYIFWDGRSVGMVDKNKMMARNIAPANERPDWRVAERELVRWMKRKGFRFYERSSVRG